MLDIIKNGMDAKKVEPMFLNGLSNEMKLIDANYADIVVK